jgi:hypothetical protein
MNLLRSICCLFGSRCAEEEPKATKGRHVAADLGQDEAESEKTGKEQMGHMGAGASGKTTQKKPRPRR